MVSTSASSSVFARGVKVSKNTTTHRGVSAKKTNGRSALRTVAMAKTAAGDAAAAAAAAQVPRDDLPEVLIAGGGIAGLITALALQRKGMKVKVFEKVKEYKLFGGPIQLQCNAQGALDSIAPDIGAYSQGGAASQSLHSPPRPFFCQKKTKTFLPKNI
jgi:hypothetical protein